MQNTNNRQQNDGKKVKIEFEIDKKQLAKEIEKKIDIAMRKTLRNINDK